MSERKRLLLLFFVVFYLFKFRVNGVAFWGVLTRIAGRFRLLSVHLLRKTG
jgi:hypothetical protein